MIAQTDKQLIRLVEKDKEKVDQVFTAFYKRYKSETYNYCLFVIDGKNDAEEVFQDGWMKFWENLKYKNKILEPVKFYLFKILHDKAIDKIRINNKLETDKMNEIIENKISSENCFENELISKDNINQIKKLLNKLNHTYKEVFAMYWFYDMNYEEIASILNIKVTAVRTKVYRATELMKIEYKKINNAG